MDKIEKAYESIAQRAPSAAISALAGENVSKRILVREALMLAAIFDEADWNFMRNWLDTGDMGAKEGTPEPYMKR